MARSLGLAAYRAIARRADAHYTPPPIPRPDGQLIWMHAGEPQNILAVRDLANRLSTLTDKVHVLITQDEGQSRPYDSGPVIETDVPSEHPAAISAFLKHWSPDLCLWTWGGLRQTWCSKRPTSPET